MNPRNWNWIQPNPEFVIQQKVHPTQSWICNPTKSESNYQKIRKLIKSRIWNSKLKSESNPILNLKSNKKWIQSSPEFEIQTKSESNPIPNLKFNKKWIQSSPEFEIQQKVHPNQTRVRNPNENWIQSRI